MKPVVSIGLLLAALMSSCGAGSGKGLDAQGLPVKPPSPGGGGNNSSATLAHLQQTIFGNICARCHSGAAAPRGLRLDSEDNSYAFLVSHASDEVPALMRVNPGKPDQSYIVKKIEGASDIVGGQMPLGGPYLSQEQIKSIRDWIANGAPRTGTGSAPTQISKTLIEKNARGFSASVHFSRAPDFSSLGENAVRIFYLSSNGERSEAQGFSQLLDGQELQLEIRSVPATVSAIEIVIASDAVVAVLDEAGKALDGDMDGSEGGDYHYVYQF
jgi:mono/diheme cytochrome c family protein